MTAGTFEPCLLVDSKTFNSETTFLWWCVSADDVIALQGISLRDIRESACCKSGLSGWSGLAEDITALKNLAYIFVCAPSGPDRDELTDELTQRTPIPVLIPEDDAFHGCQSVRQLLEERGISAVERLLFGAKELPVQGLIDIASVDCSKNLNEKRTLSGFRALDSQIGGFSPGELSVWTGKRGDGKSTILGQVLLEAVNQGGRVCAYSGELPARQFKLGLMQQAAGYRYVDRSEDERSGRVFYTVQSKAAEAINEWWRGRLFLTDIRKDNAHSEGNILTLFEYAYRRYNCNTFLVDNIMTAELKEAARVGYWQAQSAFTGRLVAFAKAKGVHVHLVAHPRKTEKRLEADDVGGSSDITNRADNVIKIERVKDEDVERAGHNMLLTVLKNREFGATPKIEMDFNEASRRFYQTGTGDRKVFSWERMI